MMERTCLGHQVQIWRLVDTLYSDHPKETARNLEGRDISSLLQTASEPDTNVELIGLVCCEQIFNYVKLIANDLFELGSMTIVMARYTSRSAGKMKQIN